VTVQGDDRAGRFVVVEYRDVIAEPLTSAVRVFASAAGLALLFAGGLGWLIAGRVLAPIRTVTEAAASISESDLRQRIPVRGRDDVAALAETFNRMLDRLDAAFVGQRQFLDDAGHELRTPLTILRSHLELLNDDTAPSETNRALVLDEIARMNRIIEDLLLLAKAERPDFITLGTIEVADVTAEAMAKARLLADRTWGLDALADVSIRADRQRLTQALLQLAANAVTHTQPGDRITFGSSSARSLAGHGSGCGSRTPGRASHRTPATRSSTGSPAAAARSTETAPGWVWRSSGPSPARTAATSGSRTAAPGHASSWTCPPCRPASTTPTPRSRRRAPGRTGHQVRGHHSSPAPNLTKP
jgi:HAMP domain-containing protein